MAARNLYAILEVPKSATPQQIKRAYYALAHRFHPDKHPEASDAIERFREASYAYAILSDRRRRKLYDRFGTWALHALPNTSRGEQGLAPLGSWRTLLGGLATELRNRIDALEKRVAHDGRGDDESLTLNVAPSLLLAGGTCELRVRREKSCSSCQGTGAQGQSGTRHCLLCQGKGRWLLRIGPVEAEQPCPMCHGRGHTVITACPTCSGKGRTCPYVTLSVRIPPLTSPQRVLRLAGQGGLPKRPGADRGALCVHLRAVSDDVFQVDGCDLQITWPIAPREAVLGARIVLPMPQGDVSLEVPGGAQQSDRVRIEGAGLPDKAGNRGQLFVALTLEVPQMLSDAERALWESLPQSPPAGPAYPKRAQAMQRLRALAP